MGTKTEERRLPTGEDWAEMERRLNSVFGVVKLKIDDYDVTLEVRCLKPRQYVIAVFVRGRMDGKWLLEDCEERRRFCCERRQNLYTAEQRKRLNKWPKKDLRWCGIDPSRQHSYWLPWWTSFNSLKRHLLKHNTHIEIVREYAS